MPIFSINTSKKKPKKDYSQYLSSNRNKPKPKSSSSSSSSSNKYSQYLTRNRGKAKPSTSTASKPSSSGITVKNEQSRQQVTQQLNQLGQPAQPQQQGFASKVLNAAVEWFKGTPIGSAITGTEFQPPSPEEAALAGLPLGGVIGKTFGAAAKLGAKEIAKRTAAMAAHQAGIKATQKSINAALLKQATNSLSGSTAKAASGKIVFGRDAAGKLASSLKGWGKTIPSNIYPLNTKTAAKTTSYLKKLGYSATAIGIISGYLFSIPWSLNEKSDALTTITIAQRDAVKAEDWETVAEYDALIQEISDVSWAETLAPFYNVGKATMDKFTASKLVSEKSMAKLRESQARGGVEEESRFNQEATARQEAFEDYNTMAFGRQQQADQEMQQFWQNYLDQKQAGEEEAREFWAEYQQNKQDFWKAFQENKSKSNLGFGLLR